MPPYTILREAPRHWSVLYTHPRTGIRRIVHSGLPYPRATSLVTFLNKVRAKRPALA